MSDKWERVEGIGAMLAFAAGRTVASQADDTWAPAGITLPRHVGKEKCAIVTFTDGAQMCCISAVEQTGYCDTCADEEAWTGYFVKLPAVPRSALPKE